MSWVEPRAVESCGGLSVSQKVNAVRETWLAALLRIDAETMLDHYNLQRFIDAQRGDYERALSEIRSGQKRSHWMWYIFPQLAGLGESQLARLYAVSSLDEARAYLSHPVFGHRLRACVAALQDLTATTAVAVFGHVDEMKLRSSLTLFAEASAEPLFSAALQRWCAGKPDERTLSLLER